MATEASKTRLGTTGIYINAQATAGSQNNIDDRLASLFLTPFANIARHHLKPANAHLHALKNRTKM